MKCLVLDYGGTALKYGIIDTDANLTDQGEIPAPNHSVEEYISKTGEIYDRFRDQVEGIAISMPGTFTDDGVGYPPAVLAALKEPESSEDAPHILGLHVVEQIAAAHGGTAVFEQSHPHGARAIIRLPLGELTRSA